MHAAVPLGETLYIHGGCSENYAAMEDIWKFKGGSWSQVMPLGFPPPGRWLHTASIATTAAGPTILIFGGGSNTVPYGDMWSFDVTDESWVEVQPYADHPFPREGHAAVMLTSGAKRRRRRRRLLMLDQDHHVPSSALENIDEALEDPSESAAGAAAVVNDMLAPRVTPAGVNEFLFIFGGASEPGLVSSAQNPTPM